MIPNARRASDAQIAAGLQEAIAALRGGQYRSARATLLGLPPGLPADPGLMIELARRLVFFNEGKRLLDLAELALSGPPGHPAAEADLAALLSMTGVQEPALRLISRAMSRLGPHAPHFYNRSQLRAYLGRFADAESDLRRALALEPGLAKAHWALSKLPATGEGSKDLAAARKALASAPAGSVDEAFLRFALFNRLDRLEDTEAAWTELQAGCVAKRANVRYDAAEAAALFARLQAQAWTVDGCGDEGAPALPIFIVGMHRTGTTLLERMLGNHSEVREGGELYDFPAELRLASNHHFAGALDLGTAEAASQLDASAIGRGYLARTRWRAGDRRALVDKLPSNHLNVGFIRRALPAARILHVQRAPMDTCFSNLKELFSNACAYSYDFDELAGHYAGYRRLMAHWHAQMPKGLLDVAYEDLVADPESQCRRVLAHCGLGFEAACLDVAGNAGAVNTASSAQVRQPVHRRSVGAWRRYARQLEPLRERLEALGIPVGED